MPNSQLLFRGRQLADPHAAPTPRLNDKPAVIGSSYGVALFEADALGSAATLREYWTFESDFLNGLDAGTVLLLGSQQPLPAMCQAQPKLAIVFIVCVRGEFSALLNLILEEIGRFEHCGHHNKSPAHRGFNAHITPPAAIRSGIDKMPINPLDVPFHRDRPVAFTFN